MSERRHSLSVVGVPAPQGSKQPGRGKGGALFVRESNKRTKPWRQEVIEAMIEYREGHDVPTYEGPIGMRLEFRFPGLKTDPPLAVVWKPTPPDADKLERLICDAGTLAKLWKDDGQVVEVFKRKVRGHGAYPGVTIEWWEMP